MGDSRCRDAVAVGIDCGGRRGRRVAVGGRRGDGRIVAIVALAVLVLAGVDRGARGQEGTPPRPTAPAQGADTPRPAAADPVSNAPQPAAPDSGTDQPLSLRYRFLERYGKDELLERPDQLVQYQVGSIETNRIEVEQARGAPVRREITTRTIYSERPARLGRLGEVTAAVRRYDLFRVGAAAPGDPRVPTLLQGLTLWYVPHAGMPPELINLSGDRPLRQFEYDTILKQVFFPRLTSVLPPPTQPVLIQDTWTISRPAAAVLMARVPEAGEFRLEGKLERVDHAAQGTALTAIIELSGEFAFEDGDGALRARIWFEFEPIRAAPTEAAKRAADSAVRDRSARDREIVDARGHVSKVIMTLRMSSPLDEEGRLREIRTGELQMQRRRVPLPADTEPSALPMPQEPPKPDEKNSWVLYDDPERRFHFSHPQELTVREDELNPVVLHRVRPDGTADTMIVGAPPRESDSARDRKWSDPQAFVKDLQQNSSRRGDDVIPGQMGWLPEQDWDPLNRRVYRYEAALRTKGAPRYYLDAYLVLFTRGDHFVVQAMTDREDHIAYRSQAEALIRSLEPGSTMPATAGAPSATRPSSARSSPPSGRPSAPPATRSSAPPSGRPTAPPSGRPTAPPVPRPDGRP